MMTDPLARIRAAFAGRYEIAREIGRGGMAVVYLAEDVKHGRKVAIKILKSELAPTIGRTRFFREIHIAAQLNHPNILPLYDSGEADGLLYYVMPYVAGESLRQRLEREMQLPLEEALRIVRDVAEALISAHRHGILHRDVKPSNILLDEGRAVVSDFGIARAITQAAGERLTETGLAMGTRGYMSPEQAAGDTEIDERSDQYSLACVLYEMLAGEPPYTGPSARAILTKQLTDPVPSVRTLRETVTGSVERALKRALAKVPADRFESVEEFLAALESGAAEADQPTLPAKAVRKSLRAGAFVGAAILVGLIGITLKAVSDGDRPVPSATRYVIFPFDYNSGLDTSLNETVRLQDAISRWTGVSVVDPFQLEEARGATRSESLTQSHASELARRLGAGRFIRGDVSMVGDSVRVRAGLYDALAAGTRLYDVAVRLPRDLARIDSVFAELADRLLFGDQLPPGVVAYSGTRSYPARLAYAHGQAAVQAWDLAAADTEFTRATALDRTYSEAHLWQALVRSWSGAEPARWSIAAEQAALGRDRLSTPHRLMVDALRARASGDLGVACDFWDELTELAPRNFATWYGRADCLANDAAVIADPSSPSGWAFRSSYHTALSSYQRAFELNSSILTSLGSQPFEYLRGLFMTARNKRRRGLALPPDTTLFAALPSWQGDSVAFVPYTLSELAFRASPSPTAASRAVLHLRSRLKDVTLAWVTARPASVEAVEALAIALYMVGDPAALDTLNRARALSRGRDERLRVAGTEVWMRLAVALPSDLAGVRRARQVADSILSGQVPGGDQQPLLLTGLAALTGRAGLAARYARERPVAESFRMPPALYEIGPALLVYAALGGPVDSLRALERRVSLAIEESLDPDERAAARREWLARAATLAFATYPFESLSQLVTLDDYLVNLQAASLSGDQEAVHAGLEQIRAIRKDVSPADLTLDALYPEAEVLAAQGDLQQAADWLDPTLRALPQIDLRVLSNPVVAASLVRAMALRARIANELGDREAARQWADAVIALWSDTDEFLQPIVTELQRIVDESGPR